MELISLEVKLWFVEVLSECDRDLSLLENSTIKGESPARDLEFASYEILSKSRVA